MDSHSDATVTLEIVQPVVVGLSVLAILRVLNQGKTELNISSRLNLMEGDVHLLVTNPNGDKYKAAGAGGEPDTFWRTVTLLPGQQILGCVNLLYTSVEEIFSEPGIYTIEVEYHPSPIMKPWKSEPVIVTACLPQTESEHGVAALLQDKTVKRALILGESDVARDTLQELADRFGETLDGKLARFILAGSKIFDLSLQGMQSMFLLSDLADPFMLALRIKTLSTPFNSLGERLLNQLLAFIENPIIQSGINLAVDSASIERALRIIRGEPVEIE